MTVESLLDLLHLSRMAEGEEVKATIVTHATFNVVPPEAFNFKQPQEWMKWSRRFERFREASGLASKDQKQQVNTFIYCLGDEADDLITAFKMSDEDMMSYNAVKNKFDEHFKIKKNVIYERAKFFKRYQRENEPVDVFINDLYKLVEHCEFGQLANEMIRDRIVVGVTDGRLSEALQMDSNLTVEKAIDKARQSETVKAQQGMIRKSEVQVEAVKKIGSYNKNFNKAKKKNESSSNKGGKPSENKAKCKKCGASPSHKWENCPANAVTCYFCKKRGHYSRCCMKKVGEIQLEEESSDEQSYYLGEVNSLLSCYPWFVNILINTSNVKFKVDTGADVTLMSKLLARSLNIKVEASNVRLYGPGRKLVPIVGKAGVKMKFRDKEISQDVYVVEGIQGPLLGRPAIKAFNLLNFDVGEVKEDICKKFHSVFHGIGRITTEYHIRIKENATPYAVSAPRRLPLPLRDKVKIELKRMVQENIIQPIEVATEWCAPIVAVLKKNGSVRICVDFTELNKYIVRERLVLPSVDETLAQMAGAKLFSKLDANSGFWQVPLSCESSRYTTFVTPFGRFCFKRLPFGLASAPEHFQRRVQEILEGLEGVVNQADDIVVFGRDKQEHDSRLRLTLSRLQNAGVTLNADKCEFEKSEIKFLGHIVDGQGVIKPDPEKTRAISEMLEPQSRTEVRRFLGLVNYLRKFVPRMAEKTKVFQDLLVKRNEWIWTRKHEKSFQEIKQDIQTAAVLKVFDIAKQIRISADASSIGIGAVLEQQHNDSWVPVIFASRTLSDAETRYAQIEKESLALVYACEKFQNYILGTHFLLLTDHKPLVQILKSKPVSELSPRLQRFRMRLMRFSYDIEYTKGDEFYVPDTLSRAPLQRSPSEGIDVLEEDDEVNINLIVEEIPMSNSRFEQIRIAQTKEEECQKIKQYIVNGWPVSKQPRSFYKVRNELSVHKDVLMKGNRIYVPQSMQKQILAKIHEGHLGINKCRARAKESVWWPNISVQIKELVGNCDRCIQIRQNPAEPLMPHDPLDRPWKTVGIDLFELKKKTYICLVDYFSKYIEVVETTNNTNSEAIISKIKNIFARHGIPEVIRTDNGPQFRNEFKKFAKEYGFDHITSSPKYPRSNGQAERAVKIAKEILIKEDDPNLGLLAYRSTPLECGYSPAELLFGRKIRTTLPQLNSKLIPKWPNLKKVQEKFSRQKKKQKENFDKRHRVRTLSQLREGEKVWITDLRRPAIVERKSEEPRSYIVNSKGEKVRRNRTSLISQKDYETQNGTSQHALTQDPAEVRPDGQSSSKREEPVNTVERTNLIEDCKPTRNETAEPVKTLERTNLIEDSNPTRSETAPRTGFTNQTTRSGRIVRPPRKLNL